MSPSWKPVPAPLVGSSVAVDVITEAALGSDESVDARAALKTLIAASSGKTLVFRPRRYVLLDVLDFTANDVTFEMLPGAYFDGTGAPNDGVLIRPNGTSGTTTTATGTTAARGDYTLTVASAANIAQGSWVMISSPQQFSATRASDAKGELKQVASKASNTLTFTTALEDTYDLSGYTVTVTPITPIKNFTMRGGRVLGKGSAGGQTGIRPTFAINTTIENVRVEACEEQAIVAGRSSHIVLVKGCYVTGANKAGTGYGIKPDGAQHVRIIGNHADDCRHGIDTGSFSGGIINRHFIAEGNTIDRCSSSGLSTHGNVEFFALVGNTITGCGGGIVNRGRAGTIAHNTVDGSRNSANSGSQTYGHGIWLAEELGGTDLVIESNVINLAGQAYAGLMASTSLYRTRIANNLFRGCDNSVIRIEGDANVNSRVEDNTVDCSAQTGTPGTTGKHGILVSHVSGTAGAKSTNLLVRGNVVTGALFSAIRLEGAVSTGDRSTGIVVRGNLLSGWGKNAIDLGSAGYYGGSSTIAGNDIPDGTSYVTSSNTNPIYIDRTRHTFGPVLTGNVMGQASAAASRATNPGFGYPATVDPVLAAGTFTATANQARYVRCRDGGVVSSVRLNIGTSAGNVCVAAYRNSGEGLSAVPGELLASSGSVASPGTGDREIALGSTVVLEPGDWLAISASDATFTCTSSPNSSGTTTMGAGRHYQQSSAFPLPSTPSGLTALKATAPVLIGVP